VSRLALFLLGPPRIEVDGAPVEINRRKVVALLVYLAVTGENHTRDALATLFWPDNDQTQARAALRRALSVLNQPLGHWLEIDREMVGLKPGAEVWLDVECFNNLTITSLKQETDLDPATPARLAEAASLYRDDFLAGFTLRDCPGFDEWQFFQSESLRQKLAAVLERLADAYSRRQEFEPAIAYARRWLLLDPLHEPAHRQLMSLYLATNQRAAALRQYRECTRILEQELGIAPTPEITSLYERIRDSAGEHTPSGAPKGGGSGGAGENQRLESLSPAPLLPHSPAAPQVSSSALVAREKELAQLKRFLETALGGEGQVALIVGETGSGKTALLHEFARQAQAGHPDLMVVLGNNNAHTGVGDPYLPFREVLGLLSGDAQMAGSRSVISPENARRLRQFQLVAGQILAELGPDLLVHFMPGLVPAVQTVSGPLASEKLNRIKPGNGAALAEQRDLFEQFSNVLRAVAQHRPLLLALDDLQWADTASLNLLFHLGRRLEGSRILLALTYRPSDVALGRPSPFPGGAGQFERHPLEPVINELKRRYGPVELDLNQSMSRRFVEAFLDSQPNELGPEFRTALYQKTQGHPLFTIELLRDMQERADLIKNEQGRWVEGRSIRWDNLPARAEAVIAERIDRLEPELREILAVASVEGRDFTAQMIARLLQLPERQALRLLSQELEKRHQLVRETGELRVGSQRLSRYQFTHALFQQYLYQQLSAGERRLWHRELAAALVELYAEDREAITVQLAHHYTEAGQTGQAIDYLLAAGDRARDLYAHQEAADFYRRALVFLKEQGVAGRERAARTLMKLGLTYHLAFDFKQARQAYDEGFALWQWTGGSRPTSPPAPHALRLINAHDPHTLDPSTAGDVRSVYVIDQLFSGLLTLNPELDVVPEIARSWEVREGGLHYVFHLRDDATWSDGRPVTAADFVCGWQRVLHPATASVPSLLYDVRGARAFHQGEINDPHCLGVRALDPLTLLVELEQPTGYLPQLLANSVTYPVPQHVVEQYGSAWVEAEHLVTNGPFRLERWRRGQDMALIRHPGYRGQVSGNAQNVELFFSSDSAAILEWYEAGNLDVLYLSRLSLTDRERARQWHADEYVFGPALDTTYVGFNVSRPPFSDARVRQALALAIDQEALANVVLGGYDSPALGGFVPPGMPGHSPDIGLPFDPVRARQLLAEAGYPGGRGFPAVEWLVKLQQESTAEYLQAQWREQLGLQLAWQSIESSQLIYRLNETPFDIFQMGWIADYLDPDNFLRVSCHRQWSDWRNDLYTEYVERARHITNQAERLKLHRQADKVLVEEAVIIPLTYHRQHLLVKPWVKRFPTSPIKIWYWKDVVIEPH
jgi:ABC-type oligopeptide transport system substrate-binding subunit/DNA-binding SARP family transcriptional activator